MNASAVSSYRPLLALNTQEINDIAKTTGRYASAATTEPNTDP